jgi:hypothetical protein
MKDKIELSLTSEDKQLIVKLIETEADVSTPEEALLWALRKASTSSTPLSRSIGLYVGNLSVDYEAESDRSVTVIDQTLIQSLKPDYNQPAIEPDPARVENIKGSGQTLTKLFDEV